MRTELKEQKRIMQENLVIVESPAKAKTIEKFLGKEYKVMSSYGHIRDLKRKELSIDMNTMEPCYEIPEEKQKLVGELRNQASKAGKIWLASDEDREGEAISWHLCEVLGLDESRTNRIVFHEITKPAILEAIKMPRTIDLNLVNAQQARRVLDRLVGFNLSPVLWRKVKPSLSAGRVQSVAVRLIVEREREIHHFKSEPFYRINAIFTLTDKEGTLKEIKTELNVRFGTREEATAFLEKCKKATFTVGNVTKKPLRRSPAPPFTTSTLQQEAARKLGFTVGQTMMVAQHLYENGYITYMRTDSVNLSSLCRNAGKEEIVKLYGESYSKPRTYHTKAKGAQEAHEAIRPTYMNNPQIEGTQQERRLYELIWKRTLACQMDDARIEKTTAEIFISGTAEIFVANGEVVTFDGFLKVYKESTDDDQESRDGMTNQLPAMKKGDVLQMDEMTATERYSMCPARYTEASLVHKLEELGIGRPSTYAPTIQTIQQREYVVKGDQKGEERTYTIDVLKGDKITMKTKKELVGSEKGKLLPTDIGMVVNDFLTEHFKEIMDYNFTAKVEQQFDKIAEGKKEWTSVIRNFYKDFEPAVKETLNRRSEHKAGDKLLGTDPQTGKPVFAKIGKYGSVVQIGTADDQEKPRFAQIPNGLSMETMTLEDALELFKLPRTVGEYEGKDVVIGIGRFGPYVLHDKKYVSLPKEEDPMRVTLQTAVGLIVQKRFQEKKRHLKQFEENADLEILDGRYGPYIAFEGKNYRLPKKLHDRIDTITYQQCMEIIEATPVKKK